MAGGKILVMNCPHCGEAIYKKDGRGAPKLADGDVRGAIRGLRENATQAKVAASLGVSLVTVQRWAASQGKGWEELKREILNRK